MALKLREVNFVDLYLFKDSGEIKNKSDITPLGDEFSDELNTLRDMCHNMLSKLEVSEFSFHYDGIVYRVTYVTEANGESLFILRKSTAEIRPIAGLGLAEDTCEFLMGPLSTGLVLISGAMASGKTSSATSIVKARLEALGGLAFILEDPPETWLSGSIGQGRCIQVHAGKHNGGYREQLVLSLRSGANFIMIGEIREEVTAKEVTKASITGNLVISTIHADKISTTIERLVTLVGSKDQVADAVRMVIHQSIRPFGNSNRSGLIVNAFLLGDEARAVIKNGQLNKLDEMAIRQNTVTRQTP